MPQELTNFGTTQLNGGITSGDTSLTVDIGTVFPSTGDFYLLIEDEILKCTTRSGTVLTVTRAQEGTTAVSHADNSLVKLTYTKDTFEQYFGDRCQVGTAVGRPVTAKPGSRYFAYDLDIGWLWEGGWSLIKPTYIPYARAIDLTGWTANNIGSSTWTVTNGILQIGMPGNSGSNIRFYSKILPSAPYTLNLVYQNSSISTPDSNAVGFGLYDGTKFAIWGARQGSSRGDLTCDRYNTTISVNSTQYRQGLWPKGSTWLRIQDDNTNWKFSYSVNGVDYIEATSYARNTFLTATHIVLFANRTEATANIITVWHNLLAYWET